SRTRAAPCAAPRKPVLRRRRPLRFRRLLLASLDNRCFTHPGGALRRPSQAGSFVAVVRCASAGSCSLRSTIGASRTRAAPCAAPRKPVLSSPSSAALPPAPARFARQSVLHAPGRRPAPPLASRFFRRRRPLRFRRLLLASLDNRCFTHPGGALRRPSQAGSSSPSSAALRSAPARFARQSVLHAPGRRPAPSHDWSFRLRALPPRPVGVYTPTR